MGFQGCGASGLGFWSSGVRGLGFRSSHPGLEPLHPSSLAFLYVGLQDAGVGLFMVLFRVLLTALFRVLLRVALVKRGSGNGSASEICLRVSSRYYLKP